MKKILNVSHNVYLLYFNLFIVLIFFIALLWLPSSLLKSIMVYIIKVLILIIIMINSIIIYSRWKKNNKFGYYIINTVSNFTLLIDPIIGAILISFSIYKIRKNYWIK